MPTRLTRICHCQPPQKIQPNGKGKREQSANAPFRTNKISVLKKEIYISSHKNRSK
jgi:hypothetical protein